MNNRRETLMLAHNYNRSSVNGWYYSTKLDGVRALWDGGISRGLNCNEVPWANIDKHFRYINTPKATGLWTRLYQPIQAPDWLLDQLPKYPLDGELWLGNNQFQKTISVVKRINPGPEWSDIKFMVFDMPTYREFLRPGRINLTKDITEEMYDWAIKRMLLVRPDKTEIFQDTYIWLRNNINQTKNLEVIEQKIISSEDQMFRRLEEVVMEGGEGLMLRAPNSLWKPERSYQLLKLKKLNEAEGIVVGFVWGEGKLLGKMGALIVEWNNPNNETVKFQISGFTDSERVLVYKDNGLNAENTGRQYPGQVVQDDITSPLLGIGSVVRFKYQNLSNEGIPRFGRYSRA